MALPTATKTMCVHIVIKRTLHFSTRVVCMSHPSVGWHRASPRAIKTSREANNDICPVATFTACHLKEVLVWHALVKLLMLRWALQDWFKRGKAKTIAVPSVAHGLTCATYLGRDVRGDTVNTSVFWRRL